MAKIIDRGLAGPDDPIYKGGLRVSSVLGPSALTKNSQTSTAGEIPDSAQAEPEPDQQAIFDRLEKELPDYLRRMDEQNRKRSESEESITPSK